MKRYDYMIIIYDEPCEEIVVSKKELFIRIKDLILDGKKGYYCKYDKTNDEIVEGSEEDF